MARRYLIDARCALDAAAWQAASWAVRILGRPWSVAPAGSASGMLAVMHTNLAGAQWPAR